MDLISINQSIKIVQAEPMDRLTAQDLKLVRDEETINEEGYRVIYNEDYQSWSPKDVFDSGYVLINKGNK